MAWLVCILSKQNRQGAARKVYVADGLAADIGSIAAMITSPLACFVERKRIQRRGKCRETVTRGECGRGRGQPARRGSPREEPTDQRCAPGARPAKPPEP